MPLIDKDDLHKKIREEYDRHKAFYDLYHHVERGGIVRLCNEIEDIVSEISKLSENYLIYSDCKSILDRTKAIRKELTGDAEERLLQRMQVR